VSEYKVVHRPARRFPIVSSLYGIPVNFAYEGKQTPNAVAGDIPSRVFSANYLPYQGIS
jgi:hypothetical protein